MTSSLQVGISSACRVVLAIAVVVAPALAHAAPTKDQCVDADTRAQDARRSGKLRGAREALHLCIAESCPKLVREDCAKRLDDLESAMPSITFEAKDGAGHDLSGAPIDIDPGEHTFQFETPDQPPTTLAFVIHEGDRGRRESISIGPPPPPKPLEQARPRVTPHPEPPKQHKLVALSLGAAGVVGIGIGAAFGANASSRWSSAKNECRSASDCANHSAALADRNRASDSATISTVAFVAGAAALAAGSLLFVLEWKKHNEYMAQLYVTPLVTPAGGGLRLGGVL
jgi:hypothetical protein